MTDLTGPASDRPVTVLGLGPMGRALAGALLDRGHPITVWNRTPDKAQGLAERGARRADTVAQAVAASPLVIVCVIDYDAVRAIVDLAGDALGGRTLVNLTADSPDRARTTAAWAVEHGVDYVDGSIMTPTTTIGGPSASVLYSGSEEAFGAHRATLEAFGGATTYLGADPGRAAAYDIALLDVFWTAMIGYVHAMALADTEDITASDLVPHVQGIVALLPEIITEFAAQIDAGNHPGGEATITSAAAGMEHIIHASRGRGIDAGVLIAAKNVTDRAIAAGFGDDGFSRLAAVLNTSPAALRASVP